MQAMLSLSFALTKPSASVRMFFPLLAICSNSLTPILIVNALDTYRKLWDTKQNHLPEPVPDSTSGPGAPDIEIIGAPLAFSKHGTALPPPGSLSFTMVCDITYSIREPERA